MSVVLAHIAGVPVEELAVAAPGLLATAGIGLTVLRSKLRRGRRW